MATHESIDGLILHTKDLGDHDRYLTVLTAEKGRITLLAKGGKSLKGPQTAVSQLYTYGNFEYYRRGDFLMLKGGSPTEAFYGLTKDIDRMNLAAYLCDLTIELTDEGEDAREMLRLILNALHAVSHGLYPLEQIKGAFEMRAAALSGYAPDLSGCRLCGVKDSDPFYLDVMNGSLLCPACILKTVHGSNRNEETNDIREAEIRPILPAAVTAAMRYCLSAPIQRLFAFQCSEDGDLILFSKHAETYLLSHLGHGFDSLHFFHELRDLT